MSVVSLWTVLCLLLTENLGATGEETKRTVSSAFSFVVELEAFHTWPWLIRKRAFNRTDLVFSFSLDWQPHSTFLEAWLVSKLWGQLLQWVSHSAHWSS